MADSVQVSILCFAYNHEKYIRQCLDGFLMQKDVTFEIIIHDDASTDHTADIIREYESKFPELFKPIYQKENKYSQHIDFEKEYMIPLIKGKYVAMCEGDDYWTDPYKLKKQHDAMEVNPDCFMCLHNVMVVNEAGTPTGKYYPECQIKSGKMTSRYFFETLKNAELYHINSFFARAKEYIDYRKNPPKFKTVAPVGDYPALLYFAFRGNVYYYDVVMSNYRSGSIGSWTDRMHDKKNVEKAWRMRETFIKKMREMIEEFFFFSNGMYNPELSHKLAQMDNVEKILQNDKFWYCIQNKTYKLLFQEFSISDLKTRGLSNKEITKMKLQSVFPFIK